MKIKNILIVFLLTICSFMFCCGFSFWDKNFSTSANSTQSYNNLKNSVLIHYQIGWALV